MKKEIKKISKKFMVSALSVATVASTFAPLSVLADGSYTVSINFADGYTATANGSQIAVYQPQDTNKENPNYAELREGTTSKGTASCSSETACTIIVSDGTPTKFTLGGTPVFEGNNSFNFDTTITGDMTLTVKNAAPVSSNVDVQFDTNAIAGNVATFTIDNVDVAVTVTGANISNGHVSVPSDNLGSVTFTLGNTFNSSTMQVVVRGANNFSTVLAVNNSAVSLNGLNLPDNINLSVEAKNNGGGGNDPVQPGTGEHFDGKAYILWSCESGGICMYHFDNIPNFDDGNSKFYKDTDIVDDRTGEHFNLNAKYKGWSTDAKFNSWVDAYKTYKGIAGDIDWSKVDPKDMLGDPIDVRPYEDDAINDGECTKAEPQDVFEACVNKYAAKKGAWVPRAQLQPVGEPTDNNGYVSYGDRNFKTVVYNSNYKGITIGDLSDLNYYPAQWANAFIRQDQYDISDTTKDKPTYVNAVLLEKTLNIRALDYNGFEIAKLEALDVPSDAVSITKVDGEWKLVFSSNFYDNVVFKATDTNGEVSYFAVKRYTVDAWINNVEGAPHLYAEVFFDKNKSYTDFDLTAKIEYKDGTTEKVELKPYDRIDDGLGNITEAYEVDESEPHPEDPTLPRGKGLKKSVFIYKLKDGKTDRDVKKAYINIEYKGSTSDNYAGAFAGSGKGILANIYQGEEE